MHLDLSPEPLPLRVIDGGVIRIGRTRIPLERVVYAFTHGQSPEEIVADFTTLDLADVYRVIGYYLRHRAAVDAYVEQSEREADEVQKQMEALSPSEGLRERLLARRAASTPAP